MEYQPEMGGSYGEEDLSVFDIWIMALTQPSEETYSRIKANPSKSVGMAIVWIFVSTLIGSTITTISNAIFGGFLGTARMLDMGEYAPMFEELAESGASGFTFGQFLCIPVWAIVGVIIFLIQAGVIHFIAGALGGNGSYSDLIYVTAAYAAPVGLIISVITAIPVVGCLGIFVGFFGLYLGVLTLKVVHEFEWGKAIATYAVLFAIVAIFACVLGVLMMASITALFESIGGM